MIDVAELERRMRPGAWSKAGFLGPAERLEDVIATDERTLAELGVTRDELVEPLELLKYAPYAVITEEVDFMSRVRKDPEWEAAESRLKTRRATIERRFGTVEWVSSGVARVGGRYEVQTLSCMGFQPCPWGAEDAGRGDMCARDTTEWRIRDVTRGLELQGPGLITHLIAEHGFFEGFASPYRVDPRALAELLQLGPFAAR